MVQLRASLEALVLQAWRDRWTELEWSINLKAALSEDSSELNKLCGLILKQATLSEVPNKLMFSYLSYTLAAQVVPHSSLLEAIVAYKDFERELCIQAMLDLLNFVRDRLRCNSADPYQCTRLCSLLTSVVGWLLTGLATSLRIQNQNLLNELVTSLLALTHNPFVTLCLYFDHVENQSELQAHINRLASLQIQVSNAVWIPDMFKNDFRSFSQKLSSIPQLLSVPQTSLIDPRELNPGGSHPAIVTLVSVCGSCRLTENYQSVAMAIRGVQAALRLPWYLVLRDFIRGALLIQLDPGASYRESSVTAFVYLKVPRVLSYLLDSGDIDRNYVHRAIEQVAGYHPLLNSLDMKMRSNSFHNLLEEFKKQSVCAESAIPTLMEIRNRDKPSFTEASPGSQGGVTLILKASGTVQTLERSFNSQEFALKPDKLVQMMSHMITGKSFDYICASSAAMSKLTDFMHKLMEFNRNSERANTLPTDDHQLRATMFDLSFLLLSRIKSLYTDLDVCDNDELRTGYFAHWTLEYGDVYVGRNSKLEEPVKSLNLAAEHLNNLKCGNVYWDLQSCDWSEVCYQIVPIGQKLLEDLKQKRISDDELKAVFTVLQRDVCGLVLCLAQWLRSWPISDERHFLAAALQCFIETPLTERRAHAHADRWNFVAGTARPVLESILNAEQHHTPSYSWLMHCARRQLPRLSAFEVPSTDHLKQAFLYSLRQAWVGPSVLSLIDRCIKADQREKWCTVWIEELVKLVAVDQMSIATELCLGASMLNPSINLINLCGLVVDYVFKDGNELYCVAPRGIVLARFLVQAYILAVHMQDNVLDAASSDQIVPEEPRAKVRRVERGVDKLDLGQDDNDNVADAGTVENAIKSLYRRFSSCCEDGEIRPSVYFVASFLRSLSEHTGEAAKRMITFLPPSLVGQVIRTDPKVVSAPTVLALHDMQDRMQRRRALQGLCLLRQLRAL